MSRVVVSWLARPVLALLLLTVGLGRGAAARADAIDDLVWILKEMETAGVSLPAGLPSSKELASAKKLLVCVADADDDLAVLQCLEANKAALNATGGALPSWLWDALDVYVDLRDEDYWGVIGHLGEAALCIVAQVMTAGVDICGLLEELVEVAKALADAAVAVAQFLKDVGAGAWDAIQDAGCSLGLGGCDSGTPPAEIAYKLYFAPHRAKGVAARKATAATAFDQLVAGLKAQALSPPPGAPKFPIQFSAAEVGVAAKAFTKAVDAQWTADMASTVIPALTAKRSAFEAASRLKALATQALGLYASKKAAPPMTVAASCVDEFSNQLGFAHVDRWVALYPGEAQKLAGFQGNQDWCRKRLWNDHLDVFAQHFAPALKVAGCAAKAGGSHFECGSFEGQAMCSAFLPRAQGGYWVDDQRCELDQSTAVQDFAKGIAAELASKRCSAVGGAVHCTRTWKVKACGDLVAARKKELAAGVPQGAWKQIACKYTPEPEFTAAAAKIAAGIKATNPVKIPLQIPGKKEVVVGKESCKTDYDPLAVSCEDAASLAKLKQALPGVLKGSCWPDAKREGADASRPCYVGAQAAAAVQVGTAAPAAKPLALQVTAAATPEPSPCSLEVVVYQPSAPVVEAMGGRARAYEQVRVRCEFRQVARRVEWNACDEAARKGMRLLQTSQAAGNQVSGLIMLEGRPVRVVSSPKGGGAFTAESLWTHYQAGSMEVGCQVDNQLRLLDPGAVPYLSISREHPVEPAGAGDVRRFDPKAVEAVALKARGGLTPALTGAAPARVREASRGAR